MSTSSTEPLTGESLSFLQQRLGINSIVSAINDLSNLVKRSQDVKGDEPSPKRARLSYDPSASLGDLASDIVSDDGEFELSPSIFDDQENKGPKVKEALAKRVKKSFTTKPIEDKMKPLLQKYHTPENCELLCVPRVNSPLWNELPHKAKSVDLGVQEIQKMIVKTGQVLVSLAESAIKAKKEKELLDPQELLGALSDVLAFIGNAGFQTSLKRRDLLKASLSKDYQSLCSASTPVTTHLYGDDLSKKVDDIATANRIAVKITKNPDTRASGGNRNRNRQGQGSKDFLSSKPRSARRNNNYISNQSRSTPRYEKKQSTESDTAAQKHK